MRQNAGVPQMGGHHAAGQSPARSAGIDIWCSVSAPHLRALVHDHFCPRAQLNNGSRIGLLLHRDVAVRADNLRRWDALYNHGFVTKNGPRLETEAV